MKILSTPSVAKFKCLQADCPDTCCKGWSMQVDDKTFAKYKGTDLEKAIDYDGLDKDIRVMKRDPETDYCVKFTDGICGIHAEKGADALGDACYLYPRVSRQFRDHITMTGTLSCPEIVRLSVFEDLPADLVSHDVERLPQVLKDYSKGSELKPEQMLGVHVSFLAMTETDATAERIMARIYSAAQSLQFIPQAEWDGAAPFMIKMADGKLIAPEAEPYDIYRLFQIFAGVFYGTRKKMSDRLAETVDQTLKAIGGQLNWENLNFDNTDSDQLQKTLDNWQSVKPKYNDILKKYIRAQLSFSTFPYAGLGENIVDKARLLCFKFALTRLVIAGYASHHAEIDEGKIIQAIQSIARVIDHISDPTLIFNLMNQFGWTTDAKMRGLLWDN